MKFSCIGGDRRQIETAAFLKNSGHEVQIYGLPSVQGFNVADSIYNAVCDTDAIILPLPVSRDGRTVTAPLTGDVIFIQDILQCRPKAVYGGIIKQKLADELTALNIPYCDYYLSEALTVKNAVLTAEAAIAIAINGTDNSIFTSNALVIGYGRIGKKIAYYLKALGANVTATSRDSGTRAVISSDGFVALDTNSVRERSGDFDYIFNTVPSPVMDSMFFSNCKKTAFVEDLATDAGTDLAAAAKYNINAGVYSSLPGKHSPISAAKYIAEVILDTNLKNGG